MTHTKVSLLETLYVPCIVLLCSAYTHTLCLETNTHAHQAHEFQQTHTMKISMWCTRPCYHKCQRDAHQWVVWLEQLRRHLLRRGSVHRQSTPMCTQLNTHRRAHTKSTMLGFVLAAGFKRLKRDRVPACPQFPRTIATAPPQAKPKKLFTHFKSVLQSWRKQSQWLVLGYAFKHCWCFKERREEG